MAKASAQLVRQLKAQGISDPQVLQLIAEIPREHFINPEQEADAYANIPLPLRAGQTISQPYIVALMTEQALKAKGRNRVLEIGTGSGYQTTFLAKLFAEVYSIERISELHERAQQSLADLQIDNVYLYAADGTKGLPKHAPYDAIVVTAAPIEIPPALLAQLAPGGCLVIPYGPSDAQKLYCITNTEAGFKHEEILAVRFVPLLGGTD